SLNAGESQLGACISISRLLLCTNGSPGRRARAHWATTDPHRHRRAARNSLAQPGASRILLRGPALGGGRGDMSQTRRLAAILATDVAGYSRLIGADEGGTLERLRALRREVIDPKIAEHRGRLVKTTGDGLLVEFGSVVDGLRCAVEVQREMTG